MTTSVSNTTEASSAPSGFAALNLSEPVLRAIDEVGYTEPTPVQAATYPVAITGRDIIVQARTGTGKTAAFGIPLVDKLVSADPWVQALVLAPTRELAVQSQRELARLAQFKGLHTVAIYGGAPMGRQIDELKSGAQIVSGTPGRVLDHLRRGTLEPGRLKVLVLDEMDEMLSMGFAKELNAILEMIPPKGRRQTMCFSATVDGEIRRHAERHMHEPEMISLSSDAVSAAQITHQVYMVSGRDRIGDLVRVLEVEDPDSAIIFCNMRSETERVAMGLKQAGFNADWLNGDLPQKDRERIMSSTREGKLRYLVATDVAARGIDISHLTHVINFTFPESAAVYVHRTGRTGRAGRTGCAISLVGPEELGRLYYLRLEYKISPVERSLPTHGELKTRQEIDRIGLLEAAFADRPNPNDLSVARRLLTHPENERILAGLLHTFFGTKDDVDDEAAAARRSKPGPDLEQAERAARERERFTGRDRSRERDGDDRSRSRDRDRDDRGRSRDRDRDRNRSRDRDREASGEPRDRARDSARPPRERDGTLDTSLEARDRDAREGRSRERDARNGNRERAGQARDRDQEGAGRERNGAARELRGQSGEPRDRNRDATGEAREGDEARGPEPREHGRDARELRGRSSEPRGGDRDASSREPWRGGEKGDEVARARESREGYDASGRELRARGGESRERNRDRRGRDRDAVGRERGRVGEAVEGDDAASARESREGYDASGRELRGRSSESRERNRDATGEPLEGDEAARTPDRDTESRERGRSGEPRKGDEAARGLGDAAGEARDESARGRARGGEGRTGDEAANARSESGEEYDARKRELRGRSGEARERNRDAAQGDEAARARGVDTRERGRGGEARTGDELALRDRGERSLDGEARDGDEAYGASQLADAGAPGEPGERAAREGRARDRGRGRDRGRRDTRGGARDAGAQGELIRDESSADEDALLSASEARTPGGDETATGARSAARKQRPARETDGELFSSEREGEHAAESSGEREEGAPSAGRRKRKRSRNRDRGDRTSEAPQLSAAGDTTVNGTSESTPRKQARAKPLIAVDGELLPADANGADEAEHEPHESTEPLEGLLYLNLGKRDGLRVQEVARLLRDSCELSRGQIGRIRVRDRYTFVDVPEGRLDGIIETLSGQVVHDKPLAPERAKTAKS